MAKEVIMTEDMQSKAKSKKDKKNKKDKRNKDKKKKEPKKGLVISIKDTIGELKKVSWPSKSKTFKYSVTVIISVILGALFTFGVDSAISFFLKILVQ